MVSEVPIRRNDLWLYTCILMIYFELNFVSSVQLGRLLPLMNLSIQIIVKIIVLYFLLYKNVKKSNISLVKVRSKIVMPVTGVIVIKRIMLGSFIPEVMINFSFDLKWLMAQFDLILKCIFLTIGFMCVDNYGRIRKGLRKYHPSDLIFPILHGIFYTFSDCIRVGISMGVLMLITYGFYFLFWRDSYKTFALVLLVHLV